MQAISIEYTFTYDEAKLAIQETTNSVVKIVKIMPWVGVGFMVSGLLSAVALQRPLSEVIPRTVVGLLITGFPLFSRWLAAKRARKLPNLNTTIRWEITESDLQTTSEKDSSRFSWELVTKLEERPLGFLLFPQPQIAFWLPKHGFKNDAAIERFRALAESKSIPFRRRT